MIGPPHFINNKYRKWYLRIVEMAASRVPTGSVEMHHTIPKSLGGTNESRVALKYREHFLSHWLLTKFTTGNSQRKMFYALWMISRRSGTRLVSSWQYSVSRSAKIVAQRGKRHTAETLERMRIAQSNRSQETRARMSASLKGHTYNTGQKRNAETRARLSEASRNRSPQIRAQVSAALSAYHAQRRAGAAIQDMKCLR
jgi:hypothetical protein